MKKLIILLFIPLVSFGQTAITDDNIHDAVVLWEYNQTDAEAEYGHISNWDTSNVTNMSYLFFDLQDFNEDIGNWDVSNVTDMSYMFYFAIHFDQDISDWNVSNVTNMKGMFRFAMNFMNGYFDLEGMNNWDVSNVTNMQEMFSNMTYFGLNLSSWDVSNVTDMSFMFANCNASWAGFGFLSEWDVSNVTSMVGMFYDSDGYFNTSYLGNWDVSNVTNMASMFGESQIENISNLGLENWDVSNVTNMAGMFANTAVRGNNLENWDVSNVTNMNGMFYNALLFGVDIIIGTGEQYVMDLGLWDISNVTDMNYMFYYDEDPGIYYGLSTTNYDKILMGWAQQDVQQGVSFNNSFINYCEGESARQYLIDNFNWVIGDGGLDCSELSINENLFSNIELYPNPSSDHININVNSELEAIVFDLLGKELLRENILGKLDISSLEKGTYILNLIDGVYTSTHKIIKE